MKSKFLSILLLIGGFESLAGDLKPIFLTPTAQVLPKGVRNFNYNGISSSANEKFNDNGVNAALAEPLVKALTFQNIMDGKINSDEKAAIMQVMATTGSSLEDSFGQTTGEINVSAVAHVPAFLYGITKNLTVGLVIPVIDYSYQLDVGVAQNNAALFKEVEKALVDKGVTDKVDEFYDKINAPTLSKFDDYSYDQPMSESGTKLGDIRVITRYQTLKKDNHRISLQGEIVLPTGEDQNINKAVDIPSGDGQTDLGLGVNYDYVVSDRLTISMNTAYTVQLKDHNRERIPIQNNSKASPNIDPNTERNLGDIWASSLAMIYERNGLMLNLAYAYQYKQKDSYSGNTFSREGYEWLEDETVQRMNSANITLGYSTISLFKRKKFPIPLVVALNHTRVLSGRNVVSNPITTLNLSVFF
jgi:hypothetical protein